MPTTVFDVYDSCIKAINDGILISKESKTDKEFHFQNWCSNRLISSNYHYEQQGRNSYPDFTIVEHTEGYEIKGLEWPGREADFDSNSQVPTGFHNGRTIYYIFGRYPKNQGGITEYPVIDLVICHGDFLNADHSYEHENKHIKGFGCYGDIMIRDRKMYVVPTPFAIADGLTGTKTLIVPHDYKFDSKYTIVGKLERIETDQLVVGYEFNLKTNEINPRFMPNPDKGKIHKFIALRLSTDTLKAVTLK